MSSSESNPSDNTQLTTQTPIITQPMLTQVLIIGAGASGLFTALTAGKRGRSVLIIDHANKAGKKILMSGGGRCNFTNLSVEPEQFISQNPHFCKSALSRFTPWQFIDMVAHHGIDYHEKEHGQLFCDKSSKDILTMLLAECDAVGATVRLNCAVQSVHACKNIVHDNHASSSAVNFIVHTNQGVIGCESLVIATGGLSIPTMGATGFGYQVAEQFGHHIVPTQAGLVPFTFTDKLGDVFASLSGISHDVVAFNERISFARPMLFTHRGLSGFAMLQLSNYWQLGESIHINLLPDLNVSDHLCQYKRRHPKQKIKTALADYFAKNLLSALQALLWAEHQDCDLANIKDEQLNKIGQTLNDWTLKPSGTEGYRTAEVTLGGVSTEYISSKTMQSQLQENLYFVGEVLDVTGWLGGYNFQWAWASGHACGQVV